MNVTPASTTRLSSAIPLSRSGYSPHAGPGQAHRAVPEPVDHEVGADREGARLLGRAVRHDERITPSPRPPRRSEHPAVSLSFFVRKAVIIAGICTKKLLNYPYGARRPWSSVMRWSFRRRADPKLGDATDLSAGEAALHRELLLR